MALSKIDELSNYEYIFSEEELDDILTDYFNVMDISNEQKEKRKDLAKQIRDSLLFLFALIETTYEYNFLSYDYILFQFRKQFKPIVLQERKVDQYLEKYIEKASKNIVDTTLKNLDLINPNFWLSDERAVIVGENEANSILNYEELQEAIEQGYTMKTWKAEIDSRTRKDHKQINGKTIPINNFFIFPDCEMFYPHDYVNGSDAELANCRCSLKYS